MRAADRSVVRMSAIGVVVAALAGCAPTTTPVAGPRPPPAVGERVALPFPPPAPADGPTPAPAASGPLQVLRTAPTAARPGLVDAVTAVFDQPMVPLATVDDLALQRSPLAISPQPPGKYRWLGTQMIAFEPTGRMPFSTTYTATIAAGERSTTGGELARSVQWQFTTPPLAVESVHPDEYDMVGLEPHVVVRFNQDLRDSAAPAARYAGLPADVRGPATAGRAERTLVLRPLAPLAADTRYVLTIPAGVHGEGPNASKPLTAKLRTYPPLTLSAPRCRDRYSYDCTTSGVILGTSTYLVDDPSLAGKVRVTLAVEDLRVRGGGDLVVTGKFRGLGKYTIDVDAGIRDTHGQALHRPFRTTVTLHPLDPALTLAGVVGDPIVLEPSHPGVLDLDARGLTQVDVRSKGLRVIE
jgi:alpha-2-macroglobulin